MPLATHIPLIFIILSIVPALLGVAAIRVSREFRWHLRLAEPRMRAIAAIRAARHRPAEYRACPGRFGGALAPLTVAGLTLAATVVTISWLGAPFYLAFGETAAGEVIGLEEEARYPIGRCGGIRGTPCGRIVDLRFTTLDAETVEARSNVMISRGTVEARRIRVGSTIRIRYLTASPTMVRPMPEATEIHPAWLIALALSALWGGVGLLIIRQGRRSMQRRY